MQSHGNVNQITIRWMTLNCQMVSDTLDSKQQLLTCLLQSRRKYYSAKRDEFFEKFQTTFVKPPIPHFGKQIVELCPLFMVKHRAYVGNSASIPFYLETFTENSCVLAAICSHKPFVPLPSTVRPGPEKQCQGQNETRPLLLMTKATLFWMFAVQYHVQILLAVKIDCSDAVQRCIKGLS